MYLKKCVICGAEFTTKYSGRIYCSKKCGNYAYRQRLLNKSVRRAKIGGVGKCVICGREFKRQYCGQKYCSDECHADPLAQRVRLFFTTAINNFAN